MGIFHFFIKLLKIVLYFFAFLGLIIFYLWSIPAIYFLDSSWHWLNLSTSLFFAIGAPAAFILIKKRRFVFFTVLGICLILAAKYYTMEETNNNKDWITSNAILPSVIFKENMITVKNIRYFDYKTEKDFTIRYYDKTFNIDTLDTLDYILSYWDGNKNIAHSLLSFGFEDGSHLVISVETRLEKGQPQTGLRGLYNQYGLMYILGDERDILRLRTNFRKEDVYLYPLKAKKPEIRKLFIAIMNRVDSLEKYPQFYNTVKHNCLTSLLSDVETVTKKKLKFDYRYIFNGQSDEMFYEKGEFKESGLPFMEFKKKHYINQYVKNNNSPIDYSKRIRSFDKKQNNHENP